MRSLLVCTHGHCFDGWASAAAFTRLRRSLGRTTGGHPPEEVRYKSCGYGPGMAQIPASWLRGDENAILDFRFTESPKVDWFFDHHATGFGSDEERERALAPRPGGEPRRFWDPTYGSCAKLIADVARTTLGAPLDDLEELITWADRIDAARFGSAEEATSVREPAMRLAAVVEQHGDGPFLERMVPRLAEQSLADVARAPDVVDLWGAIAASRDSYAALVRERAVVKDDVVLLDLSERALGAAPKFVAYAMFPRCTYSVALIRTRNVVKVGVGYNPWCGTPRRHDVAAICKREGGGGHPVVGAVTFAAGEVDRARALAHRLVTELSGAGEAPAEGPPS